MQFHKYIYLIFILGLVGCNDDIDISGGYDYDYLSGDYFIISGDASGSRAVHSGNTTVFETGDRLGMFVLDENNELFSDTEGNLCYEVTVRENVNPDIPARSVLIPVDESKVAPKDAPKYMVYYPYDASMTLEKAKNLNHSVQTDQSTIDAYEKSDLIWDVAYPDKSRDCVNFALDHAMANIIVKIDNTLLSRDKGAFLLGSIFTAHGVDLTTETLDALEYKLDSEKKSDIAMCDFSYDNMGNLVLRAAVPAFQTRFTAGTEILRITRRDGTEKVYSLAADMELRPGFNYTLYIRKGENVDIIPEADDDDSWVLEVRDPNNDKLVGYLCREYIYYVPEGYSPNYRNADPTQQDYEFKRSNGNLGKTVGHEGYMISTNPASQDLIDQINAWGARPNTLDGMVQAINSQAWVFYNLKSDKKTPDLTKGTILRILYDIKGGGGIPGYTPFIHPKYAEFPEGKNITIAIWPLPHTSSLGTDGFQGIFKPKHGHERVNTIALQGGTEGYAYDSEEWLEFYMHGGVITWDPEKNIVDKFFMPEQKITNEVAAKWGHIAIKDGEVKVSYSEPISEVEDSEGAAIGQLIRKNLYVNNVAYPLRKVCFNQFWIGKSLHNTVDNDGKDLECFNTEGEVGAVSYDAFAMDKTEPGPGKKFAGNVQLPSGFIYPTAKKGDECAGHGNVTYIYDDDFDPYNNPGDRKHIAYLYNLTAFTEGKLKPRDTDVEEYRFPSWADMVRLRRYGGFCFAAKWITDDIRTKLADESYVQTTTEALREGMLLGNSSFCANISGLDFRAYGMKFPDTNIDGGNGKVTDLGVQNYFFIDSTRDNLFYKPNGYTLDDGLMYYFDIFRFAPWHCWANQPMDNYRYTHHQIAATQVNMPIAHSRIFAPVRIIMSFKDPIGNGAAQAEAENLGRSLMPRPQTESRNVLVPLMK